MIVEYGSTISGAIVVAGCITTSMSGPISFKNKTTIGAAVILASVVCYLGIKSAWTRKEATLELGFALK